MGNIDHLVVGPGVITIIETKANRGLVSVRGQDQPTVDGRPLPRDALVQVDRQRRAVLQRMGLGDVDPDRIVGYEWLICFPRARLDPTMNSAVKRHLVDLGVSESRLATRTYGEDRPAVPGHDERAWRYNRRSEFAIDALQAAKR